MKIQAINTNTNFKGLFTDKSAQNNGNWRMEYQPYSWESNNTGKMANKERIDVFASKLPDNEEIFTKNIRFCEEVSEDILGTASYYKSSDGRMRRTIDEMPSMNREESLKVLDKKLEKFLDKKQEIRQSLEKTYKRGLDSAEQASNSYDHWANHHELGIFERSYNKTEAAARMNKQKMLLKQEFDWMYENSQNYIKLMGSIDAVKQMKENGQKEIKQLEELRKSGKLIDISRRDIVNPNEVLKQALTDIRAVSEKFLCLPHKLISMEEVLKVVNPRSLSSGYNNEIVNHVEKLIKTII